MGEPQYIEFLLTDLGGLLQRMAELDAHHRGWINFQPAVDVEDVPPPRGALGGLLSGRGPEVPLATWTPEGPRRGRAQRPEPPTIGVQHAAGPRATATLAALGHPVPNGWVVLDDHAKRGLVVAVPPAVPHAEVVTWLLRGAALLTTIPLTGRWRAAIYEP